MINPINKVPLAYKPKPLPKGLIYHSPEENIYNLIETKTGNLVGKMRAFSIKNDKNLYSNCKANDNIFHIQTITIKNKYRYMGWGKYFIKFARNESFSQNCGGRISLVAYNYETSPHAFYKKLGFITRDEKTNQILDEYVKRDWIPFHWDAMEMYLPTERINYRPTSKPQKHNLFDTFRKKLSKIKSIISRDFFHNK